MLFCQLGRADSLREICNGLGCCLGRLVHVGIAKAPCRSTLSYANEHRPAALFEDLFFTALARFRDQQALGTRQHKFRFKNKLLSLDSRDLPMPDARHPEATAIQASQVPNRALFLTPMSDRGPPHQFDTPPIRQRLLQSNPGSLLCSAAMDRVQAKQPAVRRRCWPRADRAAAAV